MAEGRNPIVDYFNNLEEQQSQEQQEQEVVDTADTPEDISENHEQVDAEVDENETEDAVDIDESVDVDGVEEEGELDAQPEDVDFDALFREKTGGKFDNWENFESFLESTETLLNAKNGQQELPSGVQQLLDYVNGGGDVKQYLETALADYDSFSDEAIVKQYLQQKYPALGADEIDYKFAKDYGAVDEEGNLTKDASINLKITAADAREAFKSQQSQFSLDLKQEVNADDSARIAEAEKAQQDYMRELDAYLHLNKGTKFKVKGGPDISFNYSESDKQMIQQVSENPNAIFSRWVDNGKISPAKVAKDISVLNSIDQLLQVAHDLGKSEGVKEVTGKMKSPNTDKPKTAPKKKTSFAETMLQNHPSFRKR